MPMTTIQGYECLRCGHMWRPRGLDPKEKNPQDPKVCPKCKSAWWNVPREKKVMASKTAQKT